MKRIFSSSILVLTVLVFLVSASSAQSPEEGSPLVGGSHPSLGLPGIVSCPASAAKEVLFVTYARDNAGIGAATSISITNLNPKTEVTVACQFFFGFGNSQAGSDATLTLFPGETGECGTRGADPFGIFLINANANTGDFEGKARICSSLPQIAADARVSSAAAGIYPINVVKKVQRGD